MELLIYVNGKFLPQAEAKVSVFDHGLLYGDGVFEGIRAYNGRIFKLERHLDRLFQSAKAIDLKLPHSKEEFTRIILETCRRNDIREGYIRPIIKRGPGDLGLDPRKCKSGPSVIVIAQPSINLLGKVYERGLKVVTSSYRRVPPQSLSPSIKSLNYLNNIIAKVEANQYGADEALMLDIHGYVSEASAENVFIVRNHTLVTPFTSTNLPGVTREAVLEIAPKLSLEAKEQFFTLYDVWAADEAFITGSAAEIAPGVHGEGPGARRRPRQGGRHPAREHARRSPDGRGRDPRNEHRRVHGQAGVPGAAARHREGAVPFLYDRSVGEGGPPHRERSRRRRDRGRSARPNLHGTSARPRGAPAVHLAGPPAQARPPEGNRRPDRRHCVESVQPLPQGRRGARRDQSARGDARRAGRRRRCEARGRRQRGIPPSGLRDAGPRPDAARGRGPCEGHRVHPARRAHRRDRERSGPDDGHPGRPEPERGERRHVPRPRRNRRSRESRRGVRAAPEGEAFGDPAQHLRRDHESRHGGPRREASDRRHAREGPGRRSDQRGERGQGEGNPPWRRDVPGRDDRRGRGTRGQGETRSILRWPCS